MTPKSKHESDIRFKLRKYGNEVFILRALMLFFLCRDPKCPIQPVNVVKVIERNIYHKKPALSVIQFSYVSKLQTMH